MKTSSVQPPSANRMEELCVSKPALSRNLAGVFCYWLKASYAILTFPPLSAGPGISHNSPCSNPLCLTVIEKIKQDDVRVLPEWELAWQLLLNNSC